MAVCWKCRSRPGAFATLDGHAVCLGCAPAGWRPRPAPRRDPDGDEATAWQGVAIREAEDAAGGEDGGS